MGLTSEGTPVLQFLDKDGEPLWTAPGTLPTPSKSPPEVSIE